MSNTVLIVKKDELISMCLKYELNNLGFKNTYLSDNYNQAMIKIEKFKPDIVVLDLSLKGDMDGVHLADFLLIHKKPFVFLLSDYNSEALEYISDITNSKILYHPYKVEELTEQINILCKSKNSLSKIELKKFSSFKEEFSFTKKEYQCVKTLFNKKVLLSHDQLKNELWPGKSVGEGTLRSLIRRVRGKTGEDTVSNSHGIGYKLNLKRNMYNYVS